MLPAHRSFQPARLRRADAAMCGAPPGSASSSASFAAGGVPWRPDRWPGHWRWRSRPQRCRPPRPPAPRRPWPTLRHPPTPTGRGAHLRPLPAAGRALRRRQPRASNTTPSPATTVRASADGTVVFAGPVAGTLHVTLRHGDGVRTSYSFLGAVDVVLGQRVRAGDRVGTAGERLHFGAARGMRTSIPHRCSSVARSRSSCCRSRSLRAARRRPRPGRSRSWRSMAAVVSGIPGVGAALGWLYDRARSSATYATQLHLPARGLGLAADLGARLFLHGPCSDGPPPVAPVRGRDRVAITVAGLGSSSSDASIDALRTADLGYDDDRVVRFSYAGGRVPGSAAALDDIATHPHETGASQGDLHGAARRLADL